MNKTDTYKFRDNCPTINPHLLNTTRTAINLIPTILLFAFIVFSSNQLFASKDTPNMTAAKTGDAKAEYQVGYYYEQKKGDYQEAVKWYQKSADQNYTVALYRLGRCYEFGRGVDKDFAEAVKYFRQAVEQDHVGAQYRLGRCYELGQGVTKDYKKALKFYHAAADQDYVSAQYRLGHLYKQKKNHPEALKWYRLAAKQGHSKAQKFLVIEKARQIAERKTAARKATELKVRQIAERKTVARKVAELKVRQITERKAAELRLAKKKDAERKAVKRKTAESRATKFKEAEVQYKLGLRYVKGEGVIKDEKKAFNCFLAAAKLGYWPAQYKLGTCYQDGTGVAKNNFKSIEWYDRALKQAKQTAKSTRPQLYPKKYALSSTNASTQGSDYTVPALGIKLVYVAPGSFEMGLNSAYSREKPAHRVTLTKGYWIGKYEVTQSEYQSIMKTNPSHFKGSNKPVEKVSWNNAVKFCEKLTARERAAGRLPSNCKYRLPTEAEWEFAARGGTSGSYKYKYSGSHSTNSVAWYLYNADKQTHEVGTKSANELGIHDMSGNVWEWCNDRYGKYSSSSETDPTGASSGSNRVVRSGSWNDMVWLSQVSSRFDFSPGRTGNDVGFRLVKTVPDSEQ